MADDGRATAEAETGNVGASAGGKLRTKRPHRRPTTPYERPPLSRLRSSSDAAAADGANGGAGSWFSKLVAGPASRILAATSSRLFSSVLGKQEPALPPPPLEETREEEKHDDSYKAYNDLPDKQTNSNKEIKPDGVDKGSASSEQAKGSDSNWVAEVEQFLTQTTFSMDEFNRLSKFLQSRTIDLPEVDSLESENATTMRHEEPFKVDCSIMVSAGEKQKILRHSRVTECPSEKTTAIKLEEPPNASNHVLISADERQNTLWNSCVTETPSSFLVPSNVLDDDCASPLEIAKAYMSRTSVYGPVSRSKERTVVASNSFTPKLSRFSLAPKSPACLPGAERQEVHNYFTPSSQRSRIRLHNMVKSPCSSSVYQTAIKATTPGSIQWKHSETPFANYSKKRGPLVDDIFASVGPMRRVRTKSVSTKPDSFLSVESTPLFSGSYTDKNDDRGSLPNYKKRMADVAYESNILNFPTDGKKENSVLFPACFPSESSHIGAKISKHLDKIFPSPKDKKVEIKASKIGEASNNEKRRLSYLDGASVHSESLCEVASLPKSTWKNSSQLQIVPPLQKINESFGSGNASILVSESVTRDTDSNRGDHKFGSGNVLNDHNHFIENHMPEVSLKVENDNHKDKQIPGLDLAVSKTETRNSLSNSFGKINATETTSEMADEKLSSSSADGSGFTFPVPMVTSVLCEPPQTPSIIPSATVPSFSFGANGGGKNLVFSFVSSSTVDINITTPQFNFSTGNKAKVSFSSAGAALPALASSCVTMPLEVRNGSANGGKSSSETLLPTFSNANEVRTILDSGSSATVSSFFSNTDKGTSLTPRLPQFTSSAPASTSTNSSTEPSSTFLPLFGATKQTFSFSKPFVSGGLSAPAFSFSSTNHKPNAAALDFISNGSLPGSAPSQPASNQTGQGTSDAVVSNPVPLSFNAPSCFTPSSSGLGASTVSPPAASIFQFNSPKPDFGQALSQGTSAADSGGDKAGRRFIKINRDRLKRR